MMSAQTAFISGNDTICDNGPSAIIKIDFAGIPPFNFEFAINGITQPSITTTLNPYIINTKEEGTYTLVSVLDAIGYGSVSGQAFATIRQAPKAEFTTITDTLSILYPSVQLNDVSIGNIVAWTWDFGDNTANEFTVNPFHIYKDSIGVYQLSLIVFDDFGCSDTTSRQLWVADEYWMYIPNSFTPDLDGKNDKFCIEFNAIRNETFLFKVYNSQGDLMYQNSDPESLSCNLNRGWDGSHYKTDSDLNPDTYVYEMYFQDFEGWKHKEFGFITLIR